jgi:hypothetical protein
MLGKAIWVVVGVVLSVGGANAAPRSPVAIFGQSSTALQVQHHERAREGHEAPRHGTPHYEAPRHANPGHVQPQHVVPHIVMPHVVVPQHQQRREH